MYHHIGLLLGASAGVVLVSMLVLIGFIIYREWEKD